MCMFCGGTCGGAGDALLPSIVAAGSLVVMRVRMLRSGSAAQDVETTLDDAAADSVPGESACADSKE
jgi:hypothetical protein